MVFLRVVTGCLLATALFSAAAGCAESAPLASASGLNASGSSGGSAAAVSAAESSAIDAVGCVLGTMGVSRERCTELATSAGTTVDRLARADHSVVDQLGEVIVRRARAERMPAPQRAGLARWFDLGMAAAREASVANAAMRAVNLQRARADEHRSGDLDAIEEAAQRDSGDARARAQLDALMTFAREGLDGAREAEAIAVLVALARVDGARQAHESLRADSVQSSVELAVDVAGASSVRALNDRPGNTDRSAQVRASGTEGPSLDQARARLRLRGSEVCARATSAVRAACELSTQTQ